MKFITSISMDMQKEPIWKEFKNIARRENKPTSLLLTSLIEEYVKAHTEGNSSFKLDAWNDPDFKPFPTIASNYETWLKYISKLNPKERDELKRHILKLDKAFYSKSKII